jgi:hypothetical protein
MAEVLTSLAGVAQMLTQNLQDQPSITEAEWLSDHINPGSGALDPI